MFKKNKKIIILVITVIVVITLMSYQKINIWFQNSNYMTRESIQVAVMGHVDIDIVENGETVNELEDIFSDIILSEDDNKIKVGKKYKKQLSVRCKEDSADIYARVVITKKWTNKEGNTTGISPELIEVDLSNNGWFIDEKNSTSERIIAYYPKIIKANETIPFMETVSISSDIDKLVKLEKNESAEGTIIETDKIFNGLHADVNIETSAIQAENMTSEALKEAWEADLNIDENGNLSLK